jgi:predicted ABC-type ATPase
VSDVTGSKQPRLLIVAGPNGSGKSTSYENLLPDFEVILDSDEIARTLRVNREDLNDITAGRELINRLRQAVSLRKDILLETTLSGRTLTEHVKLAKSAGYDVTIWFFWLDSVSLSLLRIAGRVQKGGHDVPESVCRRRFPRSVANFFHVYMRLADTWIVFDNSSVFGPLPICRGSGSQITVVVPLKWKRFLSPTTEPN